MKTVDSKQINREFNVDLGERSYPIVLYNDFSALSHYFSLCIKSRHLVVISNPIVAGHYLDPLCKALADAYRIDVIQIDDGERAKSFSSYEYCMTRLIELGCQRDVVIVALGGGVVGDLAGFVAATYQRGVDFIQIPTTLLAQVDSSVGGKTAINHPLAKNMVGAFYQPRLVYMNLATLVTLPQREYSAGLAEVIKYGMIKDAQFFEWLEQNSEQLLERKLGAVAHAIEVSCLIKANIVADDEREQGQRALLNFGHTFGHALEAWYAYKTYLHGEAVAIGMLMATEFCVSQKLIEPDVLTRLGALLKRFGLPTKTETEIPVKDMLSLMQRDKKNAKQQVTLILLRALADAFVSRDTPHDEIEHFLQHWFNAMNTSPSK